MPGLLRRMPAPLFDEWIRHFAEEPWGLADATLAAWGRKRKQTPSEMWAVISAASAAARGTSRGRDGKGS